MNGNENVKMAVIGLLRKTTILQAHHAVLYISLPSLHNNCLIARLMEDVNKTDDEFFFVFLNLRAVPKKSTPEIFAYI